MLALYTEIEQFDVVFKYITPSPYPVVRDDDPARIARNEERNQALGFLSGSHYSVRQESFDLYAMNLIRQKHDGGPGTIIIPSQFLYEESRVVQMGQILYSMMELHRIDRSELEHLASLMRDDPTFR